MTGIEEIRAGEQLLAVIIRAEVQPSETTFITGESLPQQIGFVVYPAGGEVVRHVHRPIKRVLDGTSEVLVIREGRCEADFYDESRAFVATRQLVRGDVVALVAGGHGFRALEDTTFFEIKQGPYTGIDEKETF